MKVYTMPNAQYVITTSSVNSVFGGLTEAMLQRSRLFSKYAEQKTTILTFNYNEKYPEIINSLMDREKINNDINIINLYEFFKNTTTKDDTIVPHSIQEEGLEYIKAEQENTYRYFKNGLYVKYKRFNDGKLVLVDYFNENRSRTHREEYTESGHIHRITYMDLQLNLPKQELYYRNDGTCYLNKFLKINPETKKVSVEKIFLFNNNGTIATVFKSNLEFQHYFMDTIIGNKTTYLIGEERGTDPITMSYKNDMCYKIYLTHNIHLRKPYHFSSVIKLGNRPVMENMSIPDAVVILTNKQKKDIIDRFGNRTNYFVIPHAIKKPNDFPSFHKRDLNKIVMLARYHEQKQIDHAIRSFKLVVENSPKKTLEIYGFGELEKNLLKLIQELNLQNNVFLKGFNSNPTEVLQTAALSILSSEYEGFGLVILESLANGCPVVSYDLKYGPSDMIEHGSNGFLAENLNIDDLGNKIIEATADESLLKTMSENAYKSVDKFSEESFVANWINMFEQIVELKDKRHSFSEMDVFLLDTSWKSDEVINISGSITLHGDASTDTTNNYTINAKLYNRDTKDFIIFPVNSTLKSNNEFDFKFSIDFNDVHLDKSTLDLSIVLEWENCSFEKRVGYKKEKSIQPSTSYYKNTKITPYFTKEYDNLSFSITPINNNSKNGILNMIFKAR